MCECCMRTILKVSKRNSYFISFGDDYIRFLDPYLTAYRCSVCKHSVYIVYTLRGRRGEVAGVHLYGYYYNLLINSVVSKVKTNVNFGWMYTSQSCLMN